MRAPEPAARSRLAGGTWRSKALAGAIGGLIGGIAMGVVLQLGTDLIPVFGQLLGDATLARGWVMHLITSVLFGLIFAGFVSLPLVNEVETTMGASVLLGVIHATALSYVTIGVVLPVGTLVLGFPELAGVQQLIPGAGENLLSAFVFGLGHVLYGIVLGAVYAVLRGLRTENPRELLGR